MDLSQFIEPKSDQLNADALLAGPKTIRITAVKQGTAEQPVCIFFENDNGKPWKPCKSMRRVLVVAWGTDATKYAGKRLTLVNDQSVVFGGQKVGGIRISHMSGIASDLTMALTATRAQRKPYTVKVLKDQAADAKPSEPTHQDLVLWLGDQYDNVVKYLTKIGRIQEGQTLADLTPVLIAKLYQNQAFLDSAGITLTQQTQS